ncbi:MAG: glycosyltransferase [Deinococcales bacterium]|jgi:glycosyltransferase involved in cell wall biosynthesis
MPDATTARPGSPSSRAPRVCVTLPVYNGARFLREALDSVFTQDYPNVVARVLDNASTDGTRTLLNAIRHPRLEVVLYDEHVPVAASYARAAEQDCGDYLVFLAADDRLVPGALSALVGVAEDHPDVGFVYGQAVVVQEGPGPRPFGMAVRPPRIGPIEDLERYILRNGYNVPLSTILFRRQTPGFGIDPSTRNACDLDLLLQLGRRGVRGIGIAHPVLYLREHEGALSDNRRMLAEATLDTLLRHERTSDMPQLYRRRARRVLLWAIIQRLAAGDQVDARDLLGKYQEQLGVNRASLAAALVRVPWLRMPLELARRVRRLAAHERLVRRRSGQGTG